MSNLNNSESSAVLNYVREIIANASINPDLRGKALVDSIPANERSLIDEELISAYLKMEVTA